MTRHALLGSDLYVDGGIDIHTAPLAIEAGADVLVVGTAIFGDKEGSGAGLQRLIQVVGQL